VSGASFQVMSQSTAAPFSMAAIGLAESPFDRNNAVGRRPAIDASPSC